jgi:hypothetical protein
MSEPTAEVQVTSFELAAGTIRSVTITGEDGATRVVQVSVPPGTENGAVLHIYAPGGDVDVRVLAADTTPETPVPPPVETTEAPEAPASAAAPAPIEASVPVETFAPAEAATPIEAATPPPFPPVATFPPPPGWTATPPAGLPQPGYGPPVYGPSDKSRRKIVLFTGIAAAVVVLVVALITANTGRGSTDTTSPTGQQALPAAPTTTTTPPESAADYQTALNGLATALNNGLTELNNAQTPTAISTAVTDLTNGVTQAQAAFGDNPPANTAAANAALVTALQDIDSDFSAVGTAATGDQVCLGSAATALLSRQTSINALRNAVATLTDGSGGLTYQFGAAIPAYTEDASRAGSNGAIVAGGVKHGLGELTITNSGDTDATVALVKGQGAPLVTVYMGHGGGYTLHHVPDGTYTVYVTSGDDWDAGARLFSRDCDFQQFDQTMDFRTTSTQYTTYTITLTPVAGGDATLSEVDPGVFPH